MASTSGKPRRRKTAAIKKNMSPADWCLLEGVMHKLEVALPQENGDDDDDLPEEFRPQLASTPIKDMAKLPQPRPSMACMPGDWPIEFMPKHVDPGALLAVPHAKPHKRKEVIMKTKMHNKHKLTITMDKAPNKSMGKSTKGQINNNKYMQQELNRVHSRAYHRAFLKAKREGKSVSDANGLAREEARLASFQFRAS